MAKSDRLIISDLRGGGKVFQIVSLGVILKYLPAGVPQGFVQEEGKSGHFKFEKFTFKAKLRTTPSEELFDEEGNPLTLEDEIIAKAVTSLIDAGHSISFSPDCMPCRNDHKFRLEPLGFVRDKKSKEVWYGLHKL